MTIKKRLLLMFSVTGLTGISAIFLPFTYGVSPMEGIREIEYNIWKLAVPFFLSVLISGALLHWIISGTLSKFERWFAFIISILVACLILFVFLYISPYDFHEWLVILATIPTLAIGFFLVIRSIKVENLKQFSPIMAMQTVYVGNCVLCTVAYWDRLQIGAYCALVTAVLYIAHMIMISLNKCSTSSEELVVEQELI